MNADQRALLCFNGHYSATGIPMSTLRVWPASGSLNALVLSEIWKSDDRMVGELLI